MAVRNKNGNLIDKVLGLMGFRRPKRSSKKSTQKATSHTSDDIYAQISANLDKQTGNGKSSKAPKKKKKTGSYIGRTILSIFLIGVIVVCISVGAFVLYILTSVDGTVEMDLSNMKLAYTSIIYAKDQNKPNKYVEVTRLHGDQNRIWVDFQKMPKNLSYAFVAVEDKRFFAHQGVDWKRTFSAFTNMFVHIYDTKQGGSTITQQLVKNITKDDELSAMRKIVEIMRARYVEGKYTKETILECYLNTIHLGPSVDGVEVAANYYFDKHVGQLNLTEMAAIAACTKSPEGFNPYTNAKANKDRRNFVLSEMYKQEYITEAQYKAAIVAPLVLRDKSAEKTATPATVAKTVNSYFVDAVIEDVIAGLMDQKSYSHDKALAMIYQGGFNIYTTLDTSIQDKIDKVYAKNSNFLKAGRGTVLPQSSICIMDYEGHIVAMEGGRGKKTGNLTLNRATQTMRQPGSAIKPLAAYAPSIEYNLITYGSKAVDSPITTVIGGRTVKWPKNYTNSYSGNTSIIMALQKSINTVAVKLVQKLTPRKSFDFVTQKLGISTLVSDKRDSAGNILSDINLSALGVGGCTYGVTVKEMTAAYATFGNLGTYWEPTTFTLVTDQMNKVVLKQEEKGKKAMGEDTSNIMNKLLQNVVVGSSGTAKAAAFGGYPIFAKTGTTTDDKDRWFVGGTPYYVAACWYGYDQPKDVGSLSMNPALKVWKACMTSIHTGLKVKDFPQSEEVVYRRYCTYTGKIATYNCTSTALGWYKADDHKTCSVHGGKAMSVVKKPVGISASNYGGSSSTTTVTQTTKSTKATTGGGTTAKTQTTTGSGTKPWDTTAVPTTTITTQETTP